MAFIVSSRNESSTVRVSKHTGGAFADMNEVVASEVKRITKRSFHRYEVSTAGYKRTVTAVSPDRAAIVFFLKEQPQVVGFAFCVKELRTTGRDEVLYGYAPGFIEKHFPELTCIPRAKNLFRVIEKKSAHSKSDSGVTG